MAAASAPSPKYLPPFRSNEFQTRRRGARARRTRSVQLPQQPDRLSLAHAVAIANAKPICATRRHPLCRYPSRPVCNSPGHLSRGRQQPGGPSGTSIRVRNRNCRCAADSNRNQCRRRRNCASHDHIVSKRKQCRHCSNRRPVYRRTSTSTMQNTSQA